MLIPIKRFVRNTGDITDMLLNTRYVYKIEPIYGLEPQIHSRIIMPGLGRREPTIIYCIYELSYLRGLLTKARNAGQEE